VSTTSVITLVDHRHEADLVAALEGQRGLEIARRCADVAELVSVAAAGAADVALVSGGFRGIDREVVRTLAGHGVGVIGVLAPGDEAGERTLRQLGVRAIVRHGMAAEDLRSVIAAQVEGRSHEQQDPGTGPWSGPPLAGASTSTMGGSADGLPATGASGTGVPGSLTGLGHAPTAPGHGGSAALWTADSQPPTDDASGVANADRGSDPRGGPAGTSGEAAGDLLEDRPGIVVAVWGPLGSPGRTTLAVTLAAVLAARGVPTLLVDADTHGASIAQVLGLIDEAPGIASAARLSDQGSLDLASLSRVSPEVSPLLRILTGLPRADRWPELRPGAMADILAVSRQLAQVIVVDCGHSLEDDEELSYDTAAPRRNGATLTALGAADHVVLVGAGEPVGLQRLVRGVGELAEHGVNSPLVLVNKVRSSAAGKHPERSIREVLGRFSGLTEVDFLPWSPQECDAAVWAGRSLVEVAPGAPLTQAIGRLAARLSPDSAAATRTSRRSRPGRAGASVR
jgi:MinD-like ATPase involved in chromosome partitioning or flagellar assembly